MSNGEGLRCLILIFNDGVFGATSLKFCFVFFFFLKNTTLYSIQLFPEKAIICFIIIHCAGGSHACPMENC